jgi:putative hydrolase of the HAD superfamily
MAYMSPRAVLVDLDDTLFDHAFATRSALAGLLEVEASLARWPIDAFVERHDVILEALHAQVLAGSLTVEVARIERFRRLLEAAGADRPAGRAIELAGVYRAGYERSWRAVPGAVDLLDAVRDLGLAVVIVTNNGVAEQRRKLAACDLAARVDAMVTSEEAGISKPSPEIFRIALDHARAGPGEAVMLGDAWATDIQGALDTGIRPIWFNRTGAARPDHSVREIRGLTPTRAAIAALTGA